MVFPSTPHPSSLPTTINNQMTFLKLHIHFKEMMALKSHKLQPSRGKYSLAGVLEKVLN